MRKCPRTSSSALRIVSEHVQKSRALGQRMAQKVCEGMSGLDAERAQLLEEYMAAFVLRWMMHQGDEAIADMPLREFTALTKLLLEITDRRHKQDQLQAAANNTAADGMSAREYQAMYDILVGKV